MHRLRASGTRRLVKNRLMFLEEPPIYEAGKWRGHTEGAGEMVGTGTPGWARGTATPGCAMHRLEVGANRRLVKNRLIFLEKPPIYDAGKCRGHNEGAGEMVGTGTPGWARGTTTPGCAMHRLRASATRRLVKNRLMFLEEPPINDVGKCRGHNEGAAETVAQALLAVCGTGRSACATTSFVKNRLRVLEK